MAVSAPAQTLLTPAPAGTGTRERIVEAADALLREPLRPRPQPQPAQRCRREVETIHPRGVPASMF